jgi:tRNA-modifying protein YgfZ
LSSHVDNQAIDAQAARLQMGWRMAEYGPQFYPLVLADQTASAPLDWLDHFCAVNGDLGVIQAQGDEVTQFLQGQLSNDISLVAVGEQQLSGYCTPKGRLLASITVARVEQNSFLLLASRPLIASLTRRLSMFVMRTKCTLTDLSNQVTVIAVVGQHSASVADVQILNQPALPSIDSCAGAQRSLWVVSNQRVQAVLEALAATHPLRDIELWRWTQVRAGIPFISQATSELFVPQMVNLELVNGVSFKKGCYPGQEIVARSHYLGKAKRRMFLGHCAVHPAAGADVQTVVVPNAGSTNPEPVGQIVFAAQVPVAFGGGFDCLFESQISAVSGHSAALLEVAGSPLRVIDLPYALELSA